MHYRLAEAISKIRECSGTQAKAALVLAACGVWTDGLATAWAQDSFGGSTGNAQARIETSPPLQTGQSVRLGLTRPVKLLGDGSTGADSATALIQAGETAPVVALRAINPFPPDPSHPYCLLEFLPDATLLKDQAREMNPPGQELDYTVTVSQAGELWLRLEGPPRGKPSPAGAMLKARCFDAVAKQLPEVEKLYREIYVARYGYPWESGARK